MRVGQVDGLGHLGSSGFIEIKKCKWCKSWKVEVRRWQPCQEFENFHSIVRRSCLPSMPFVLS